MSESTAASTAESSPGSVLEESDEIRRGKREKMESGQEGERERGRIMGVWASLSNNDFFMGKFYLVTWFTLNVIITLYCKAVFSIHKFPYPMLMTTIHLFFTAVGVQLCAWIGLYKPKVLTRDQWKTVLWFSLIFTSNIWLSNASLMAVSVNLHQVVRTTIPLFTMALSWVLFSEKYSWSLLPSVLVVIVGVAATVWGDMEFDAFGMTIVVIGCFLSSLKGILTQKTQVGALGMSALDLLRFLSPLAVIQLLVLAFLLGEFKRLSVDENLTSSLLWHLVSLGCVAFGLNFVSFRNAAYNNPLTLNVAGNVKQVLTSLLSIWLFGGTLAPALTFGIFATAVGAFWYNYETQKWRAALKRDTAASFLQKKPASPPVNQENASSTYVYADVEQQIELVNKTIGGPSDGEQMDKESNVKLNKGETAGSKTDVSLPLYPLQTVHHGGQQWKGD